jgi:hypothetical protein
MPAIIAQTAAYGQLARRAAENPADIHLGIQTDEARNKVRQGSREAHHARAHDALPGIDGALAAVRQLVIPDGQTLRTARAARIRPDLDTMDEAAQTLRGAI